MKGLILKYTPAVFVAGEEYQIVTVVNAPCVMWVRIGDKDYYDDFCGVVRSAFNIHKISVPMSELDSKREYTVCWREINERKAYHTEVGEICEESFKFFPANGEKLTAYHISDTHNDANTAIIAANNYKARYGLDFLILNGDIPKDNQLQSSFETTFVITDALTHGEIPVVFARGNHDLRGEFAENTALGNPTVGGKTYFTIRLGNIWAMVLDCGEDKDDGHTEYMNMVACHGFRLKETEFIKSVVKNADKEYAADGIKHKLVICHTPFTIKEAAPFFIEEDIFSEWTRILREDIKPEIMIHGHYHKLINFKQGNKKEAFAQPCDALSATEVRAVYHPDGAYFAGTGFIFDNEIETHCIDSENKEVTFKIFD